MISNCLILLALIFFFTFVTLLASGRDEGFTNNHHGTNLVGKIPQYERVYQAGEDTPLLGKNQFKDTNTYYYTPYATEIPKQYESIYKAKNFWPVYVAPGEDPENRLAWVKDAPYYGKYHLPVATECPDRIRNFEWLATLPMPEKKVPKGISTGW
jgi:hypothetical protein